MKKIISSILISCTTKTEKLSLTPKNGQEVAVFASGCFWHTELLFDDMKGVAEAISGYAGGDMNNPTYEEVSTGNTGHAESVMVYYDSTKVSFATLLKPILKRKTPLL